MKIKLDETTNLEQIKDLIQKKSSKPIENLVLKHNGRVIENKTTLKDFKPINVYILISELTTKESPLKNRKLCISNCGFYGDASTNEMCSLCYKKTLTECEEDSSKNSSEEDSSEKSQIDTTRCYYCKRRIGLLGFQCRCGYKFCAKHRYANQHSCSFDYKTHDRKQLEKQNVSLENKKISKF